MLEYQSKNLLTESIRNIFWGIHSKAIYVLKMKSLREDNQISVNISKIVNVPLPLMLVQPGSFWSYIEPSFCPSIV